MIKLLLYISAFTSSFLFTADPNPSKEFELASNVRATGNQFTGSWHGIATTSKERTQLALEINEGQASFKANITLMDMGVMGWPAREVQIDGDQLLLRFPTDNSEQVFRLLVIKDDNGTEYLEGSWQDSGIEELATVRLEKQSEKNDFISNAVFIAGPEGQLSSEVIMPPGDGPFPGVVFLHGSGPQPKDASRFAAYTLAGQGVASIIFDKRGVGNSDGDWQGADFEDLARDGIAVAEYLLSQDDISYIGFFGHSQGGWIGPLAATLWEKTTFVISSAGPAVSPAREAQWGFISNALNEGATEEDINLIRHVVEGWHEGLRSADWQKYRTELGRAREKPWFEASGLQFLQYPPDPDYTKYYLPFMDYDPIPALVNLKLPLLSILTPDDESIDAMETEAILNELKEAGKDIRIKLYPGYNHGFRKIGQNGELRWPGFPKDYFNLQADFIKSVKK